MPDDYIPRPDDKSHPYQRDLVAFIVANKAVLLAKQTAWTGANAAHTAAQTAAASATTNKEDLRKPLEAAIRALAGRFQASETITDAQRESMKIPVHATTRTRAGVPTTKPIATVDTSRRFSHIIDFRDAAKPKSKAKPDGVAGCEI